MEYTVLDAIRDITQTDRAFFQVIRFLDGDTRNHIVAAHMRNNTQMLNILQTSMNAPRPRQESIVMNIPLQTLLDPSGNFMRNFMEPVTVAPTHEQIHLAVENHIAVTDQTCAICQENVSCATRIRQCGHCFHRECISEWFTMSTRCPVCRYDIRDLQRRNTNNDNDNRMHTDEE